MKRHSILSVLLSILFVLFLLMRFWAILLIGLPFLLAVLLVLLILRKHRTATVPAVPAIAQQPAKTQPPDVPDHIRLFRQVQAEVGQQVQRNWPGSIWVWEKPNHVISDLQHGLTPCILIRNAGYARAQVTRQDGTIQVNLEHTQAPYEESDEAEPIPADYSLMAAEWVEGNILLLNSRLNEKKHTTLTRDELPISDAWADIVQVLKENQLDAEVLPDNTGILVSLKGV